MTELLIPTDVEVAIKREIDASLVGTQFQDAKVGTKIPLEPKPTHFIRVTATGGGQRDLVTDTPTVVLDAFSVDEQHARDLAALAVAVLARAGRVGTLGGVPCYEVRVGGLPANLPHPTVTTHFRFTATVSAALRRASV